MNAAEVLRKYQKQCDPEGIEVQVSRQALDEVLDKIERLEGVLREIRDSKFCNYDNTEGGQYGIGVTDGHRFCANIAKEVLNNEVPDEYLVKMNSLGEESIAHVRAAIAKASAGGK